MFWVNIFPAVISKYYIYIPKQSMESDQDQRFWQEKCNRFVSKDFFMKNNLLEARCGILKRGWLGILSWFVSFKLFKHKIIEDPIIF